MSSSIGSLMTVAFSLMFLGQSSSLLVGLSAKVGLGNLLSISLGVGGKGRGSSQNQTIMQRLDANLDFNRNWTEYVNGFTDNGQNWWIGLQKMYEITHTAGKTYGLRVEVQLAGSGKWYYAQYSNFSVGEPDANYPLHIGNFTGGDAGDSFTNPSFEVSGIQNGQQFSTIDRDHDTSNYFNCARLYGGGWWFTDCGVACLTCQNQTQGFCWYSLLVSGNRNGVDQLSQARMLITRM